MSYRSEKLCSREKMGCASSTPAARDGRPAHQSPVQMIQVPDSGGAPPFPLIVREMTSTLEMSISQGFLHGGGSITAAKASEDSAIYTYVVGAQAHEGLRVVASFPKIEVPQTSVFSSAVAMATGQAASMAMQSSSVFVFTPAPVGLPLSTKCLYAPFSVDTTIGFNNVRLDAVHDGLTGCIAQEASIGFRCVGMGVVNASTDVGGGRRGVSSTALAELVFQKVHAPEVVQDEAGVTILSETYETIAFQNAVTVRVATAFGGVATEVPDLLPCLNAYGAEGWELDGFLMMQSSGTMPMATVMNGGMHPGMSVGGQPTQVPFQVFLSRVPAACVPVRYCLLRHEYQLNMVAMMMGGGTPPLQNDPRPVIEAYASRGWLLKGALNLPPEMRPGDVSIRLPVLLAFMSNTAAIPWALPVAEQMSA